MLLFRFFIPVFFQWMFWMFFSSIKGKRKVKKRNKKVEECF